MSTYDLMTRTCVFPYIRVVRVAVCQRNKERIFALFGTHRIYTINTVKRFSRAYKMPFITSGMAVNHSGQDLGYELYMRPLYAQALYDIIVMKGWQKIMYVYDSLEGENDCVASCNTTDIDMGTCGSHCFMSCPPAGVRCPTTSVQCERFLVCMNHYRLVSHGAAEGHHCV